MYPRSPPSVIHIPDTELPPLVIHIPATEFSTSHTPPPLPRRSPLANRARRHEQAAHHRAATLQSKSHRCRAHVRHATNVATTVKAERLAAAETRHRALANTLEDAHRRREQHLSQRARPPTRLSDVPDRERCERSRRYKSRLMGRMEAGERRSRILSERRLRASRFSPPRYPGSDSADSLPFGSPTARALQFDDDAVLGLPRLTPPLRAVANEIKMEAADTIAAYFLLARARRVLVRAEVLGPHLASYDFHKITACMESQEAQDAAELVLRSLRLRGREKSSAARKAAERRILLSCLVVALHPIAVLDRRALDRNSQEALTLHCARRMLLCLHVGTLPALRVAWGWWKITFSAWKKHDAEVMLRTMIEDAVATAAMRVAVNRGFAQAENVRSFQTVLGGKQDDMDSSREEHAAWEDCIARKQQLIREGVIKMAGKAGERRLNLALSASSHAHNERMVHEILIDLPGLLEDLQHPSMIPEDTWKRLRTELSHDPPQREELAARLADISAALNGMMPESFDLGRATSPLDLNVDFAVGVVCNAAEALKESQAEVFDDALESWLKEAVYRLRTSGEAFVDVVVDVLKELNKLVRRAHNYVVLYKVRHSVPVVQQYGAAWERSHFEGHTESGRFSKALPRTLRLFREVNSKLRETDQLPEVNASMPTSKEIRVIVTHAVATLCAEMQIRGPEEIPELLFLDQERIVKIQNDVQRCAVVGSLDNIARQFMRGRNLPVCSTSLKELLDVTNREDATLEDIQSVFLQHVRSSAETKEMALSETDEVLLKRMVKRTVQPGDDTFRIIHNRIRKAIAELAEEMASACAWSPSPSPASKGGRFVHSQRGLEGVNELLHSAAARACSIVLHVLSVHEESVTKVYRSM